jgi:hypothetical protein
VEQVDHEGSIGDLRTGPSKNVRAVATRIRVIDRAAKVAMKRSVAGCSAVAR